MTQIVLTEEQARVVAGATENVEVLDPEGRVLALLQPLDPALRETIRECKRRQASAAPRIPSEQAQAHLRKLDEIRRREGMDREKMHDLLRRLRAGEEA
ncbi:MAG TPA: hypothetical protein VJ739_17530 [Gemmataceae bacterium]|nr:hypothetical protein [Gemmataceae bacterium]